MRHFAITFIYSRIDSPGMTLKAWQWSQFLKEVELVVDISIPYLLILLTFLIIIEFSLTGAAEKYSIFFDISHSIIIFIFVLDLIFKYQRTRTLKQFFTYYWLDILAVFPFYLVFRLFEQLTLLFRFSELAQESQKILHEGLEVERVVAKEVQEVEKGSKFLPRFLRALQRSPRLLKARVFFKHAPRKKKEEANKQTGKRTSKKRIKKN